MSLTPEQLKKYNRNIVIPEITKSGQEKLLNSKVLIVGVGGLGSPAALYLAASGIGKIGLVDSDSVQPENLQRQVLHTAADTDNPKVISAKEKLERLNPDVEVVTHNCKLDANNISDIIKDYEVIVECSDNFTTKYLLNDYAVFTKKPLVYASVVRFEGQAMTIVPGKTSCLRCLYPQKPSEAEFEPAHALGILGTVAGTFGLLQANEVIKLILGIGELLTNKLLAFDLLSLDFKKLEAAPNPDCPVCGQNPQILPPEIP